MAVEQDDWRLFRSRCTSVCLWLFMTSRFRFYSAAYPFVNLNARWSSVIQSLNSGRQSPRQRINCGDRPSRTLGEPLGRLQKVIVSRSFPMEMHVSRTHQSSKNDAKFYQTLCICESLFKSFSFIHSPFNRRVALKSSQEWKTFKRERPREE